MTNNHQEKVFSKHRKVLKLTSFTQHLISLVYNKRDSIIEKQSPFIKISQLAVSPSTLSSWLADVIGLSKGWIIWDI